MKKIVLGAFALLLIGDGVRYWFQHQDISFAQPVIWLCGTIWFVLFLAYGFVPVVAEFIKEEHHD